MRIDRLQLLPRAELQGGGVSRLFRMPQAHPDIPKHTDFKSRRSAVMGTRGMVSSSQPLASEAGMRILQQGGTAADAAVAMAAALNVTEPCSTGIGGDAFALYYDAKSREVSAFMANGQSPARLTLEAVRKAGVSGQELPPFSALTVCVPGAPGLWEDAVKHFGRLPLAQVLQPAIELAENGFPVAPMAAAQWARGLPLIKQQGGEGRKAMMTPEGRAPASGQLHRNRDLASTFRLLADKGAGAGFYTGRVAEAVVEAVQSRGGLLELSDLGSHKTRKTGSITTTYKGLHIHEIPPPTQVLHSRTMHFVVLGSIVRGQPVQGSPFHLQRLPGRTLAVVKGMAALMALNQLEQEADLGKGGWGSSQHLHAQIESMRLAFSDTLQYCGDPDQSHVALDELLSKPYARKRRADLFSPNKAARISPGQPSASSHNGKQSRPGGDTVYFCAVDGMGNACSFINSNYMGFGTGIVPDGCGFTLQNRGHNFILEEGHANCLGPSKRPFHTIIPGMATTAEGDLYAAFGVMGGFMQPQGHMQVISNMVDFDMDPQTALDAPRFQVAGVDSTEGASCVEESSVLLEEGFSQEAVQQLQRMGHLVRPGISGANREAFGRGQIIRRNPQTGVLMGGSDPRADGQALGW